MEMYGDRLVTARLASTRFLNRVSGIRPFALLTWSCYSENLLVRSNFDLGPKS